MIPSPEKTGGQSSGGAGWGWGLGVTGYLDDAGSISEVGEAPHHILTQRLHRRFPGTAKATDQLSNPG